MAKMHLTGYLGLGERVRITVCCDQRESAAHERVAEIGGGATVMTDWEAAINSETIDAVDICAPHFLHAPMVLAAARAGKHVLLEKPMAMNLSEGRAMVEAMDAAGKVFVIGQNQRYLPEHVVIKELLEQGVIGRVIAARIDGNQFLSRIYPPGHWLFSKVLTGGGIIRTTAIHKLDLLRYWFGEVRRVTAFGSTSGLNPGMDSEDTAAFVLEFENGMIGEAFFSFAAYQNPIPTASGELVVLYGTQGMISNVNGWHIHRAGAEGMSLLGLPNADYAGSFIHEIAHFLECIETGREPLTSGGDNLNTIAIVDALYQSIETGQATMVQRL
jgi:predicted dehydrogenase